MQKTKLIESVPSITSIGICIIFFIPMCRYVDGFATQSLKDNDSMDNNDREEVLKDWKKIFCINGQSTNGSIRPKTPPQFMNELYNTIADPISGVTRGKNPHNARIVRSFVERETRLSHLYLFNITGGLEINETVIEAELHLFRKRSDLKDIHPTILKAPYYLIRVYQVLEGQNMDVPDVHRLLNVHYVGAHASGWQVFNVKQAVLTWLTGVPNLGLMVTASTVFGDEVSIEFSRDNHNSAKQPILVLFVDDGRSNDNGDSNSDKIHGVPHYYTYNDDEDKNEDRDIETEQESVEPEFPEDFHSGSSVDRRKRERSKEVTIEAPATAENKELNKELIDYEPQFGTKMSNVQPEFFQRQKRVNREILSFDKIIIQPAIVRSIRSANPKRKNDADFVTHKKTRVENLRSLDIYARAMLREELQKKSDEEAKREARNYRRKLQKRWPRNAEKHKEGYEPDNNVTVCTLRELYVDFEFIGLSESIIAPKGYSAFHCRGSCDLLPRDRKTTNHANVQAIVHKTGLVENVYMPCCVPTKLLSAPILYFDDNDNVVLKVYEDMIADNCGCL